MTFVVYIQNASLGNELRNVVKTVIEIVGVNLNVGQLQELETALNAYKPPDDTLTLSNNKKLVNQLIIGVSFITAITIFFSLIFAYINSLSILDLVYTNLITVAFIAITDIVILSIFGSFTLLQTTFLVGIFSSKRNPDAGYNIHCPEIMQDTLYNMFPAFKNIIDKIMDGN